MIVSLSAFASVSIGAIGKPCVANGPDVLLFTLGIPPWQTRSVTTPDLNTVQTDEIEFYIVIGRHYRAERFRPAVKKRLAGGSGLKCEKTETANEGVKVSYSTDAGKTWTDLQLLAYNGYSTYTKVKLNLVAAAKTVATRFRWLQPSYSGTTYDTWGLGNVRKSKLQLLLNKYLS